MNGRFLMLALLAGLPPLPEPPPPTVRRRSPERHEGLPVARVVSYGPGDEFVVPLSEADDGGGGDSWPS